MFRLKVLLRNGRLDSGTVELDQGSKAKYAGPPTYGKVYESVTDQCLVRPISWKLESLGGEYVLNALTRVDVQ
jgi:hypothetical protein